MPSYAYYEDADFDRLEIVASEIEACEDLDQLKAWWDGLEATYDDIRAQLDAQRIAGIVDNRWVWRACRALSFVGIGQGRVRRRMKKLGYSPNPEGDAIHRLNQKLQTMKAEAAFGRAFEEVAFEHLSAPEFQRLRREAEKRLEKARVERAAA